MSSEVDIANAALAYVGDTATVVSLSPPSGSVQAATCARFYPMSRDTLLDAHSWDFATKRASLALLVEAPPSSWLFAYTVPNDAINLIAILDPATLDDYVTNVSGFNNAGYANTIATYGGVGAYTPQPFTSEVSPSGATVIYTNQVNAVLRYSARVTDPTKFSPLFTETLTWLLASKVAGPLIKGAEGRKAVAYCLQQYMFWFGKATESDSNQHFQHPIGQTRWIQGR